MSDTKQKKAAPNKASAKKQIPVTEPDSFAGRAARYIFYTLLAYVPVHIFLSTWIGTTLDVLEPARVAKEFVLLFGFGLVVAASARKPWFKHIFKDKLFWAIGIFVLLHLLLMAIQPTNIEAELLALAYNTRYLVFFVYAVLLAHLHNRAHLVKRSLQVVLASAAIVLVFGVLQHAVLPANTLEKLGYSEDAGVFPVVLVDNNPDFPRVFSTQRNPNAYGSYLIIIITIAMVYLRFARQHASRYVLVGIIGLGFINLLYTYSRSAWLGFVFTVVALMALLIKQGIHRKMKREVKLVALSVMVASTVIAGGMLYALSENMTLQNIVYHTTDQSTAQSSDEVRLAYWRSSLDAMREQPLGGGPGTAGPVSIHTDSPNINENYYLQIALEVGIAGLLAFLVIIVMVFSRLWRWSTKSPIAAALMASLVGLAITNMFAHIWVYEAVAYTWWGLAGLFIVLGTSKQKLGTRKKKVARSK